MPVASAHITLTAALSFIGIDCTGSAGLTVPLVVRTKSTPPFQPPKALFNEAFTAAWSTSPVNTRVMCAGP